MHGWMGKILRVDLTTGQITEEKLDPRAVRDYIGGRGLGIHYMLRELDPNCDPLSADNMLIMATGPLTGTGAATGGRYMVMTKSPLTGAITTSNSGGLFPTALKKTGYDAVIFTGRAAKPIYLYLTDQAAELHPADDLWGKDTAETTEALLAATDSKAKVACIGPAGERQVLYASIMNDKHRAAGRSGVGAVMGSKNLKALVVKGSQKPSLADPEGFKAFHRQILAKFKAAAKENPPALRLHGTAITAMGTNNYGVFPTKNWQQGHFDGWEDIYGATLTEKYLVSNSACFSCPIGCGRRTKVEVPGFEGQGEGPEYETIYSLGSNCMVRDLAAVTKANYVCNELGLDTITMGATIATAMELYDRGYLTEEEIGMPLNWGDGQALVELTRQTGLMEGFGKRLAQGSLRLATECGHPELAMVSKGQEFAGYDPRGSQGMGLAYATSPIGASHMRGDPAYFELLGVPFNVDRFEYKGRAKAVADWQDLFCVIDSAGLCVFFCVRNLCEPQLDMPPTGITTYLKTATGLDYTVEEVRRAGERIFQAERLFLNQAGIDGKDDTLPPRLTEEPMPSGGSEGHVCHLSEMLEEYYQLRDWDENGLVRKEKLSEMKIA